MFKQVKAVSGALLLMLFSISFFYVFYPSEQDSHDYDEWMRRFTQAAPSKEGRNEVILQTRRGVNRLMIHKDRDTLKQIQVRSPAVEFVYDQSENVLKEQFTDPSGRVEEMKILSFQEPSIEKVIDLKAKQAVVFYNDRRAEGTQLELERYYALAIPFGVGQKLPGPLVIGGAEEGEISWRTNPPSISLTHFWGDTEFQPAIKKSGRKQ